jgi:hypothetical protein
MKKTKEKNDSDEFSYEIIQRYGILSAGGYEPDKWGKEVNLLKIGKEENPKIDIRFWKRKDWDNPNPETDKMGKGIRLDDDEAGFLLEILESNY